MRRNNSSLLFKPLFAIFIFCSWLGSNAQEVSQKKELKQILPQLEVTYKVRFSYRDRDVEEVDVRIPDSTWTLRELLDDLEQQTRLDFEILNNRYIAISVKNSSIDLCGILKDSLTDKPLAGATVQTKDEQATSLTDGDGRFELKGVSRGQVIELRYLGYETKVIEASAALIQECAEILLESSFETLEETVITTYLTSGISKQIDGTTRIDIQRFGTLPGLIEPDGLQSVETLPGVESVNETVSNINIRGGTSDQNLVMFDGIKMYLTGHFFGLISAFNPSLANKVNLIKNGTSSQYNEGVSGTIDIQSRDELIHRVEGGVGVNLISTDAFLQVPLNDKLEIQASGRRSINDFINTPTYESYFSRTFQDTEISASMPAEENLRTADFKYYDTSLKVLYDASDQHKFRFSLVNVSNGLEYEETMDENPSGEVRKSSLAQTNLALGATWKAQWNKRFRTQASSYLTRYHLNATNHTVSTDQRLLQENEVLESGLKLKANQTLAPNLKLLNGYQFFEVGVYNIENLNNPFFSSRIKNVIRSHSVFSELTYSGSSLFIKGGARLNYLQKFDKVLVEPRLVVNKKVGKISFKVQAEMKSQTTSQIIDLQEDFLGVESRRWILSDGETFPVIQSQQFSSGIDYKARGWYLDIEAFYKKVEGVNTSNQGFQNQHEYLRTSGNYVARGVEFLINKKTGPFNSYLTYTFGKNEYHFEELSPGTFPNNFDIRHSASLAANYSFRDLKFSIGGNLRSGRPYTKPVEENPTRQEGNNRVVNYGNPNAETLPSFFRVDLSSSYSFQFSGNTSATVSLGLLNVLDRDNIINRYYRVDQNDPDRVIQVNNTSLGFTPNALIRFEF